MVKNLSSVERIISNYWGGLNIKESLTFCSTKFLITISVSAAFPEAWTHLKNVDISRSHWVDFHHRHTSWLFCLQSVSVEPQCAYGLGVCRQQTWLLFDPFPLPHHISCWNALCAKGYKMQPFRLHFGLKLIYNMKWPWAHVDYTILFSLNWILCYLQIMEKYAVLQVCLFAFFSLYRLLWGSGLGNVVKVKQVISALCNYSNLVLL